MDRPDQFLTGKVAVVTHSASDIGLIVAASLARAGARITICHREMACVEVAYQHLAAIPGVEVLGAACDLRDLAQVETMGEQVVDRFGRVDLWVNNATTSEPAPAHDLDPEEWRTAIEMNLMGAFHGTRVALHHMLPRGVGKILNLVTAEQESPARSGSSPVGGVSSAAILSLTRISAATYRDSGISIIALQHVGQGGATRKNQPEGDSTGGSQLVATGERAARLLGVETDGRTGIIYDPREQESTVARRLLGRIRR
jgi:NAD(P)-dependent dehydrogenase (short-subunit alcohol dehydrogenase family)